MAIMQLMKLPFEFVETDTFGYIELDENNKTRWNGLVRFRNLLQKFSFDT